MKPHPSQAAVGPSVATGALSRAQFLRGAGIVLSLPLLDAMVPRLRGAPARSPTAAGEAAADARHLQQPRPAAGKILPAAAGRDYTPSPYLEMLAEHRDDFTVFSGVSHPDVDGGHPADNCFLTAAPHPGSGGFRNTISLDQFIAEHIGNLTRFPSLTLGVNVQRGHAQSFVDRRRRAHPLRGEGLGRLQALFLQGTPAEVDAQMRKLELGESILDTVAGQAKEASRARSARAIATGSTSISPACATSKSA